MHAPVLARADALLARVVSSGAQAAHEVRTPFDGSVLARVPQSSAEDVADACDRALAAQRAWVSRPIADRCDVILQFSRLALDRRESVMDLIQLESGKARYSAFEEVADLGLNALHYVGRAPRLLRPRRRSGAFPVITSARELRHPVGVVGLITPWNYPLNLAVCDAIPALLAGNAVVVKPDSMSMLTCAWAIDLLVEAGLPEDLFGLVSGPGPEIGSALIEHVDYIGFTGSTAVGREVAAKAGQRLIGASLELGGKNPMVVLADADVERAADVAVRGSFASAGQVCVSVERIYVHESIADKFTVRLVERTKQLRLGAALDYSCDVGSLASQAQLTKVQGHVDDAIAHGAEILSGGSARPDLGAYFFEPTIMRGVRAPMLAFDQETFGPVVAVSSFVDDDEATRLANQGPYGLNAVVCSRDVAHAQLVASMIRAGTVNINEAYGAAWGSIASPMGGMGDSGLGRRHADEGLLRYTEAQTIAVQRLVPLGPSRWLSGEHLADVTTAWLQARGRGARAISRLRIR